MGQFSWLDAKTGKPILCNRKKPVYFLIPRQFGGGKYTTDYYDGYGNIGVDVYEQIALWNRKFMIEHPNFLIPSSGRCVKDYPWYSVYGDPKTENSFLGGLLAHGPGDTNGLREVGIALACYDEDNAALPYQIKITYDPDLTYEEAKASADDPNQGWGIPSEEEVPIYSKADVFETLEGFQYGYTGMILSEEQMNAIYAFVSELTGMSVDAIMLYE